jgi:hypothetical protein
VLSLVLVSTVASAGKQTKPETAKPFTLAVFGDWPYSNSLLTQAPLLIDSINADPNVGTVIHVGDIHSGSMPCTGAGLNPIPATSNPGWNQAVYAVFQQFNDPLVYTPGDNEWTDCHKTKEGSSGAPLNELASVRSLFFANPGYTLGKNTLEVSTQARDFDERYPADAQFVENVMWKRSQVVFVTLNVPGSNNDGLPWKGGTGAFLDETARSQEAAARTAADIRWLRAAFKEAAEEHAKGLVIALQADMWDPEALAAGGDGLNNYDSLVQELANLTVKFSRPVLLLNGDSHIFHADQPLADPTSATGLIHKTQAVPNLTRITVQGSTNLPGEWVKITIDPSTPAVFSWENVVYLP